MLSKGFDHVRFGVHMDVRDMNMHKYAHFVFGDLTDYSDMPSRGTASYSGSAILSEIGAGEPQDYQGSSKFNVYFDQKVITGSISYEPVAKFPERDPIVTIPLVASIGGGQFTGSTEAYTGNVMWGNFYGPQAEELGGTFNANYPEHYVIGAFGAKKE